METNSESRQQRVYHFIVQYKKGHDGNSPTIREIMDGCELTSTSLVRYYLIELARHGLIRMPEKGAAAKIEVIGGYWMITQRTVKTC
jgi:SOS-response transcriptional repressor LexA